MVKEVVVVCTSVLKQQLESVVIEISLAGASLAAAVRRRRGRLAAQVNAAGVVADAVAAVCLLHVLSKGNEGGGMGKERERRKKRKKRGDKLISKAKKKKKEEGNLIE